MGIRALDSTAIMNLLQAGILAILALALPITAQSGVCGTWDRSKSWSCCTSSNRCGVGEGDCDHDSDCQDGLICGRDNCPRYLAGAHRQADCCIKGPDFCANGNQSSGETVLLIGGKGSSMQIWSPYLAANYPQRQLPRTGSGSRAANFYGRYYSCGGYPSSVTKGDCFTTLPGQLEWTPAPNARMKVARYSHTMTVVGDRLVATGGMLNNKKLRSVEILQPAGSGWSYPPWSLRAPRTGHCAVAWSSAELIVIAGFDASGHWTNTVTKYNVITGKSQDLPNFPQNERSLGCPLHQGNVVAGRGKEVWMLKGGKWEQLPDLNYYRFNYVMKEIGGKLHVFGGYSNAQKVERLDGDKWTEVRPLAAPLDNGGALVI